MPKYTLNSSLSYQITDSLDAMLTYTQYGKQKSRKNPETVWKMVTISPLISLLGSEDIGGLCSLGIKCGL